MEIKVREVIVNDHFNSGLGSGESGIGRRGRDGGSSDHWEPFDPYFLEQSGLT